MKNLILVFFLVTLVQSTSAQCEGITKRDNLSIGMIVVGTMDSNDEVYSARITKVNRDGFECEFVHTNSAYTFNNFLHTVETYATAKVRSSRGGKFPVGTTFKFVIYVASPEACDLRAVEIPRDTLCITTFPDGKTFVGFLSWVDELYTVFYLHSSSTYYFDGKWKIVKVKGGKYKVGQAVKIEFAQRVKLNL